MLAVCIAIFLLLAIALFCLDVRQTSETDKRKSVRRTISYVLLMSLTLLIPLLHFWKLEPLVKADSLEIRGQYFALNETIKISADPQSADYYCPTLLPGTEVDIVQANPLIEISRYDDKSQTLQVVAKGLARPLLLKDQVLNLRPLASQSEIIVNSVPFSFSNGWLSTAFTIGGVTQKIELPRLGESETVGSLLCEAGLSTADQLKTFFNTTQTNPPTNQLDHLWMVGIEGGNVGLVNGMGVPVKIDGVELPSETSFTIKSGDKFTYGVGRRATTLMVQIEPALNRIYIFPEKPQAFPLYRSPSQTGSSTTEIFITSGFISPSPAYHLELGERNLNLVKAGIRYGYVQPAKVQDSGVSQDQAQEQELLKNNYIVNTGLEERSYAFNQQATVGSDQGGIVMGIKVKQKTLLLTCVPVVLIWLLAIFMFAFWGGIQKRNYLFVLLPTVHLILAIRLILSYRGFALPPYMSESYEKALLASLFIPFAIFVWLYARTLSHLFDFSSYPDSYRRVFSRYWFSVIKTSLLNLVRMPAFVYFLLLLVFLWVDATTSFLYLSVLLVTVFFVASLFVMSFLAARYPTGNPIITWIHDRSGRDIVWLFVIPLATALVLKLTMGGAERLPVVNLRAEVLYAPLLLLASCRFYSWFFRNFLDLGKSITWRDYFLLPVPLLAYLVLCIAVGDFGFFIYSIPIFFLSLIITWRGDQKVSYAVFAISVIFVFIITSTPIFSRSMPALLKDSAIEYRFLAYQNPGWLEDVALQSSDDQETSWWEQIKLTLGWTRPAGVCGAGNDRARRILGAHEHFWTMFHFAARGNYGEGYGKSPLERVPFANGIAQSDNVYSLYVLSEHGGFGGIAVISVYVFLVFLLIFILTQHFASDLPPTLLLGGVAMTVLFTALYHAAGNVGGVPFTGRNLPLLSLNSNSDIILLAVFLSFAFTVIGGEIDLSGTNHGILSSFQGAGNALNKWLAAITIFFFAFYGFVIAKSVSAARDELHRGDYDLGQFVEVAKDYIRNGVISLDEKTQQIRPVTTSAAGLGTRQYLRLLIDQFNLASPQDRVSGRHFFMVRDLNLEEDLYGASQSGDQHRQTVLSVDENYFRRPSPFASKVFWQGGLRSKDSTDQQGYLSGEGLLLVLKHELDLDNPYPGPDHERPHTVSAPNQRGTTHGTGRRFKVLSDSGVHLFDLYSIEADTVLEPQATSLFVNGEECKNKTRLEPGDIIAINGIGQKQRTLTFFYQKDTSGQLASYRWINGREDFVYPQGEAFSLARPITEAVNSHIGQLSGKNPNAAQDLITRPLTLSIDAELNNWLYEELAREGLGSTAGNRKSPGLWDEINGRKGLAPRISVTVLLPHSGEVLALPSWPSYNPASVSPEQDKNDPRTYRNLLRRRDPEARLYLLNHNLDRHVLGSATKPFIATAAAVAFPELLALTVNDNKAAYDSVFGMPTKPSWQGNGSGNIGFSQFLIDSNNFYEVMIGFLGLAKGDQNGIRFTSVPVIEDYFINNQLYEVQPDFKDVFNTETGEALNLDSSQLAVKLKELFDLQVSGPDQTRDFNVWAKAVGMNLLPNEGSVFNLIAPETSNLALNRIRDSRSFVGVTLGGNTNRWNNVKAAEALARLITGKQIVASFVKLDQAPDYPTLNGYSRVRPVLLGALEGVSKTGTASALGSLIDDINTNSAPPSGSRFTIFAKTGTLEGQFKSGRNDSNIIFAAGMWNDLNQTLTNGVVVSVYIEKGNLKGDSGRATQLARRIIRVLNRRFEWSRRQSL